MPLMPRYPIFIISKGRADSRFTVRTLEELGVPYRVAIEQTDFNEYSKVINERNLLVAPPDLRTNPKYAIDCELSGNKAAGSIPIRNFVWETSITEGHKRHWILDDNIRNFYRLHQNKKRPVTSGTTIALLEDFVDRYENVKMAGMNYDYFCPSGEPRPPYYLNTRIYSCILLSNDINHRWRGKFNEDTDLSLRILKDKWCTMLFNAFLCGKITTSTMKGGNNEIVYGRNADGTVDPNWMAREDFADSLVAQHPDLVTKVVRYRRFHHECDFTGFIQKPIFKPGLIIPKGTNNYGMELKKFTKDECKARSMFIHGNVEKGFLDKN